MHRLDDHPSGRHFLQIPGASNVPDRIVRAIDHPTIDPSVAMQMPRQGPETTLP